MKLQETIIWSRNTSFYGS